jgi:hypothetical protein
VQTLDGLVDLLIAGLEKFDQSAYVCHVKDESTVSIIARVTDLYGRRAELITASAMVGLSKFNFNQYHSQENFLIGLASLFQETEDRNYLISTASLMDLKEAVKLADDGISQNIVASKGIAFKETVTLRNRVSLAPFRTFREISQPASEFIFRAKDGGNLALFEADGGAWKITAINAVAEWLKNRLAGSALGELPVIS